MSCTELTQVEFEKSKNMFVQFSGKCQSTFRWWLFVITFFSLKCTGPGKKVACFPSGHRGESPNLGKTFSPDPVYNNRVRMETRVAHNFITVRKSDGCTQAVRESTNCASKLWKNFPLFHQMNWLVTDGCYEDVEPKSDVWHLIRGRITIVVSYSRWLFSLNLHQQWTNI